MKFQGRSYTKQEMMRRVGDVSQIGGIRDYVLNDGMSRGVRAFDLRNGNGLEVTVVADRGMSITDASYRGVPLVWKSNSLEKHPLYYDPVGQGWLKSFMGGLLETCGLTHFGAPCEDDDESLGLHGPVSNLQAMGVCVDQGWRGDEYEIHLRGAVRQASVFGHQIELRRVVSMKLGEDAIRVSDEIENIGHRVSPLMVLYHMNFGFPLVDTPTQLDLFEHHVTLFLEGASPEDTDYSRFTEPTNGFVQRVYTHDLAPDENSTCHAILSNPELSNGTGLGVHVSFNKASLDFLTEWKMMGEGEYVLGIEPSNAPVRGRSVERAEGNLKFIAPGETVQNSIEVEILSSNEAISQRREAIARRIERRTDGDAGTHR